MLKPTPWSSGKSVANDGPFPRGGGTCLGLIVLEVGRDSLWQKGFCPFAFMTSASSPRLREKELKIQWVDDTHALGVFPCLASGRRLHVGSALSLSLSPWCGRPVCIAGPRPARKQKSGERGGLWARQSQPLLFTLVPPVQRLRLQVTLSHVTGQAVGASTCCKCCF